MKIFTNKFASKAKQFYIGIVLVGCVLSAMFIIRQKPLSAPHRP